MKQLFLLCALLLPMTLAAQNHRVRSIGWQRVAVDSSYDTRVDEAARRTVEKYKLKVDSVMAPALGLSRVHMTSGRPESLLGNFMADMLVESSTATGLPKADMGLMNVGGIRADMPEGMVTVGHAYLISPFENRLVVLEMKGSDVLELMRNIASVRGEAVSSSVRLTITKDGELVEATIGGEPIDPKRTYRIATIDYLAAGNDKMVALKKNTSLHDTRLLLRDVLMEYIIKSRVIDAKLEGRITVK